MATREEVEAAVVARALQLVANLSEQALQELVSVDVSVSTLQDREGVAPSVYAAYGRMLELPNEVRERLHRFSTLCTPPRPFVTTGVSTGDVVSVEGTGNLSVEGSAGMIRIDSHTAIQATPNLNTNGDVFSMGRVVFLPSNTGYVAIEPRNAIPPKPRPEPPNVWERLTREEED